jgi:hypothetical protein
VHALGARALHDLLAEIALRLDASDLVFEILERYAQRLSPDLLRAVGGDRFEPSPLRLVEG